MTHDPLCRSRNWIRMAAARCYECEFIAAVRADERERLERAATSGTITRHSDGSLTAQFSERLTDGPPWVPVSRELVASWVAGSSADMVDARARALADLRAKVETLPGDAGNRWGTADALLWRADVLALIDGNPDA